ncbi:MAG: FecR domain-containing protein [Propionivibrio sp.]|uniref:FecR family protein n=1 Tax=Propionivibrio sp. TaxID=2212460 RepID=UPI0025CD4EC5|nr:FecR family protein [Propionivibrio sp.]MBK8402027.1 FecR domain-containing protein [Propionivibrio sp.]MBK8895423.1 FecR domain-containing protein [Propionivibrio sp.]MBL0206640.1 FecR domain-containing protein [Propionivibrio sp.]
MKLASILVSLLTLITSTCFAQGAASVIFASGHAQIISKTGQSRAAVRGSDVAAGEMIDTADGRLQLRFSDGASMSLQPETRFRIDEFHFAEQNGNAGSEDRSFFSLLKGGFRTVTGLIGKLRREQYRIDTAVATIGIRGTDYGAHYNASGLAVSTFSGLVEVCSEGGCAEAAPGETLLVADRKSKPKKTGHGAGGVKGAPVMPGLPPPIPGELSPPVPPAAPPAPSATPPAASPGFASPSKIP